MSGLPDCYKCAHRRDIPGNAHSACDAGAAAFTGRRESAPLVTGRSHGVKNGWFFWPFNFDPVWLESCNSFEAKGGGNG